MKTISKTVIVAKTMLEIEAHNTQQAVLIECGMAERWEQCPQFKIKQEREARALQLAEIDRRRAETNDMMIRTAHAEACKKHGVPNDHKEMRWSARPMHSSKDSSYCFGPKVGLSFTIGGYTNEKRANLRFEGTSGMLRESSVKKLFNERAELVRGWMQREHEEQLRRAEAASVMSKDFLDRLSKAARANDLQASMCSDGRISVTQSYYNPHGSPSTRYSRCPLFIAMPMAGWVEYVESHEAHSARLAELRKQYK
jgi:hypothetical protein